MRMTFAAVAALLVCTPGLAQQPAPPRAEAAAAAVGRTPAAAGTTPPASTPATGARAVAGTPAPAARAAPVYRVELVIFRATSALGSPEDWAAEAGTAPAASTDADPDSAIAPGSPAAPDATAASSSAAESGAAPATPPSIVVRQLPAADFQMDSVATRLRASGRYVPVAHVAWAQMASPWGKPIQIPVQSLGVDAQGLTGTVALERGQFLHLALDLRYAMDAPPSGLDAPPGTVFVLDESHRVRFRERNYFDHPAFGVIALVTPDEPSRAAGKGGRE